MYNAYPDSCGENLSDMISVLQRKEFSGAFRLFYVLPSLFQSDLDRGFCIKTYDLEPAMASREDLKALQKMNVSLKLDFVLNHLSVQSPQFQNLLAKGDESEYINFFIDWNAFWKDHGNPGRDGCIVPADKYLQKLFMRKPGLPVLRIPFPDGSWRFYWNTFYQSVEYSPPAPEALQSLLGVNAAKAGRIADIVRKAMESGTPLRETDFGSYAGIQESVVNFVERAFAYRLGQIDLNARSDNVWKFYAETLDKLAEYGASIVRLDAFAYLHKEIDQSNFFNEPGTWDCLEVLRRMAESRNLTLLPEIHSTYKDGLHHKLAERGYPFYDFFFPALLIHAIETESAEKLAEWFMEICDRGYETVNMLGCHDGIPVLDVKGLLDDEAIESMIDLIVSRGGRVKNLYGPDGQKIAYYQVNAAYFSALGEDPDKMLLARAVQMFAPGIPLVWYLDIFAGKNDIAAADEGGHKEINRTNLSLAEIDKRLKSPLVQKQLDLIRFRSQSHAFGPDAVLNVVHNGPILNLKWINGSSRAVLMANLSSREFNVDFGQGMTLSSKQYLESKELG